MKYLEDLQYDDVSKETMRSPNILYLEASVFNIHREDGLYLYDCSYCVIFLIKFMYFLGICMFFT